MKNNHYKHSVDHLLESAPTYHLEPRATKRILETLDQEYKHISAAQRQVRLVNWAFYAFSIALLCLTIISLMRTDMLNQLKSPSHFSSPLAHEQEDQWELSPLFKYDIFNLVGSEAEYGLVVGGIEKKLDGTSHPVFQEQHKYRSEWLIMKPFTELKGKQLTVIATSRATGEVYEYISSTPLEPIREMSGVRSLCDGSGCIFPNGGLWKLTLLIDNQYLGDIVIDVETLSPATLRLRDQLEQQRQQIATEFANAFDVNLDDYAHVEIPSFLEDQSLIGVYFNIRSAYGDYMPQLYLNDTHNSGFIFEKKRDGTLNIYKLVKEAGSWEVAYSDSQPGQPMEFAEPIHMPNYEALTQEQIDLFILSRELVPLDIKSAGNLTYLLYEKDSEIGSFVLGSEDNVVSIISSNTMEKETLNKPVSISGSYGSQQGADIGYVEILIFDEELIDRLVTIKVTFHDGFELVQTSENRSGYIIPHPKYTVDRSKPFIKDVVFLDVSENVIYSLRDNTSE